jgi:predicted GNAT superfamily acetyltransferase
MVERTQTDTQFKGKGIGTSSNSKPVCVMLPPDLDEFVRGLPDRSQWLREAIREKIERELGT